MNNPGLGGRNKKAPYESQHYRIPLPIKPVVEMLATRYRQMWGGTSTDSERSQLLRRVEDAICADAYASTMDIPGTRHVELKDKLANANNTIAELQLQLEKQGLIEQALEHERKRLEQQLQQANQEIERLQLELRRRRLRDKD